MIYYVYVSNNILRLMNAAIRFVFDIKTRKTSITPFLKKAHLLPVRLRIRFKVCLMMYKCLNGLAPRYLSALVHKKNSLNSLRVFRDTTLFSEPRFEKQCYKNRKFEIYGPRQWNMLPRCIRETRNIALFKVKLKTYLFKQFWFFFS